MLVWLAGTAVAAPEAFGSCEAMGRHFEAEVREAPPGPIELWWILDDPCIGEFFDGSPPPEGQSVWCEDRRGRRLGRQTNFADGRVVRETEWINNQETGTRRDYGPTGQLLTITEVRNGDRHGERIEWAPSGGVTVTTWARGDQTGPMWHIDTSGNLALVEYWRNGQRHGRSCAWRLGVLEVDTLWRNGEPEVLPDAPAPPPPAAVRTPTAPED